VVDSIVRRQEEEEEEEEGGLHIMAAALQ